MSLLIKNWSIDDWKELLKWAKVGANNAMIGEFTEVEELRPHGDLIDRDALPWEKQSLMEADEGWALPCVLIKDAPTIIPAEEA